GVPGAGPLGTYAARHDKVREPGPFMAPTSRRARKPGGCAEAVEEARKEGQLAPEKGQIKEGPLCPSPSNSKLSSKLALLLPRRADGAEVSLPAMRMASAFVQRLTARPSVAV